MSKTALRFRIFMPEQLMMESICHQSSFRSRPSRTITKLMLVMKLTIVLLTVSLFSFASGSGQLVTISGNNLTLQRVFSSIQKQTGYAVLVNKDVYENGQKINLSAINMPLKEALDLVVKQQSLEYTIEGRTVFISKRKTNIVSAGPLEELLPFFRPVKGRVTDSAGGPLSGASISIKNKRTRTLTDANGAFTIDVSEGDVLQITYVGYETSEIRVTAARPETGDEIQVILRPAVSELTEVAVVNTGYQKINRENVVGAVGVVTARELDKRNAANIMQNLEGSVPGLVQYRNVATIRGVSTLQASSNILVVVDGLPIEGSINDVNPYDIESVSVLKDAAAASIYGARASNGVIVVSTKRARERRTVVELSSNTTITNKPDYSYYNYMNGAQQADFESAYYQWYFTGGGGTVPNPVTTFETALTNGSPASPVQYAYYQRYKPTGAITQAQLDAQLTELRKGTFIDQYKEYALKNQLLQQHNLALRTNNGRSQNNLVINYTTDNLGIINQYNRVLNLFYKGTYSLGKWLDIDYGVNSVMGKQRTNNNGFASNPFNVPAYYNLVNPDGSRAYYSTERFNAYNTLTETNPALYSLKFNHLDELSRDFLNTSILNTRYYVNMTFKPLDGLTISPMFQYEDNRRDQSAYSEAESYTMRLLQDVYTTRSGTAPNYSYTNLLPKGGKKMTSQIKSPNYTARAQANYQKEFGKHGIIALAGAEFRQTRIYGQSGILLGYDDQLQSQSTNNVNFQSLFNINTGSAWNTSYPARQYHFSSELSPIGLTRDELHRYASGYSNLTYTYDRKYNVFGALRKDYADLFGGDEKYRGKPLWSIGAGWTASNEPFMKQYRFVDYLKVRTSYGLTGNIRNVTAVLAATTGTNTTTQLTNATVANPPNPELRWEKTATTNIGMDFTLFANRLRGSLDWYRRVGTDLFAQKRLDPSEGFTNLTINNASMVNRGFEFNLGYDWFLPQQADGFRWSSRLTGALNKNKITEVDELTRNPLTLAGGGAYKVGYPVRSVFSFRFAGLNANGLAQWYDSKGNAVTTTLGPTEANAIMFSGDADPRVTMSFNNEFAYKGFSLAVFAVYYGGNYFRARPVPVTSPGPNYGYMPNYMLNSWTPTKTNTDIPGTGQYYQVPATNQYYYSDNLVRPADFIKIRNIVFGYDLPRHIAAKLKSTGLRLRVQVNNPKSLWIRQKDVHADPETANGIPVPTAFVMGINANF